MAIKGPCVVASAGRTALNLRVRILAVLLVHPVCDLIGEHSHGRDAAHRAIGGWHHQQVDAVHKFHEVERLADLKLVKRRTCKDRCDETERDP